MFTIIIYHEWSNEYKFDQFLDEYVYFYIYRCVCVCGVLRGLMVTYYEIIYIYWLHV